MAGDLDAYRKKRSFDVTPEPDGGAEAGSEGEGAPQFVIHEHHATRLHWDLRLEHDGVLASWAVPNGIPQDPKQNRKAVHVEDHPLSYIDFEGTIPAGSYGAGRIAIWDAGTFTLEKWREDEVILVFHGERLRGKYALFQAGKSDKDWLLHRMDPPVDLEAEPIPLATAPMLATPGAIPRNEDEWAFEVKWDGVRAIARSEPGRLHLFSRSGRDITGSYPEVGHLNRALSSHSAVLDGELIAFDEDGKQSFQAVQQRIHVTGAAAIRRLSQDTPATFMIFDLLWLDGHSLTELPYEQRRSLLEQLELAGPNWQVPASHVGAGTALLQATREQGLEGVIAKRLGSGYESGARSAMWRKIKNTRRQEVVIGGFTPGKGGRDQSFGALQLGVFDEDGALRFAGGVGSGFTMAVLGDVRARLREHEAEESPFEGRQPPKETRFVEPVLVCEVEFAEWSRDGSLRHAVFQGLREDTDARDVRRERVVDPESVDAADGGDETGPPEKTGEAGRAGATGEDPGSDEISAGSDENASRGESENQRASSESRADPRIDTPMPTKTHPELETETVVVDGTSVVAFGRNVKVTNLDKVLYPATGTTKREVIEYYAAIAGILVPHLAGRPVTLKRYPDGVDGPSFFEKNANRYRPDWVATVPMETSSGKTMDFVDVSEAATLLWTANLAGIELHPSLSRSPRSEQPTMLVFDLDPGPGTTVVECCTVGLEIRDLLAQLELDCWAKTSGSKGLQLYAPLNVDVTYEDTKPFAHAVASLLESRHPELVVSQMKKSLRDGKVLIDWSQNDQNKTTVSVYSLRARETPTVSTPVTWDEVEACAASGDPETLRFSKDDVLERVGRLGDLFAPLLTVQQTLPKLGG
ncbi:MAG: non-homologous end-joining DNA ligase [Solirubrobacteraceae bacterium]|nr:non-homologous end-joining DNA ligase [Solirubrobacteraceae bacterium]